MSAEAPPHPPHDRRPSAPGRAFLLLAYVVLYAIACALPALHLEGIRTTWSGVEAMVLGSLGVRLGHYSWLANIPGLAALWCVMKGRTKAAIACSVLAVLLSLQTFWLPGTEISLGSESFNRVRVVSVGAGCYVWIAALLLPLAAALLLRRPPLRARKDFAG